MKTMSAGHSGGSPRTPGTLPKELVRAPDGHLTDVALTCVADGELDLLPGDALAHLDGCDLCSHRLGEAALLSIGAQADLATLRPSSVTVEAAPLLPAATTAALAAPAVLDQAPRKARRPVPVAAIAAALVVAVLTAGPGILDTIQRAPALITSALGSLPFLARVGAGLLRNSPWGGHGGLFVKGVTALVMVVVGLRVARMTSRSLAGTNGLNGGAG